MKSIIGKIYVPFDNSWCVEIKSGKSALIKANEPEYTNTHGYLHKNHAYSEGYNTIEPNAKFVIVSEPYQYDVDVNVGSTRMNFINVRSTITSKVYRTLYDDRAVNDFKL